ncbi:MAG TPA: DinB family protein [Terriglobales bacterium]|nr:DinB family protein [Terriglobales bacterium]
MTMITPISRLFVYDDWANRKVLGSIRVAGCPLRPLKLMSHILSAERLWHERMKGLGQTFPVWPDFTLQQCEEQASGLRLLWKEFLSPANESDLSVPVTYKNTEGESFTSEKEDVMLHVITHSAYHRGQIAADMRASGFTPAYTDFIHAVRQGFME